MKEILPKEQLPREQLRCLRQSAAQLLAASLCKLFPGAILAGIHVSDIDFTCDFVLSQHLDAQILPLLEEQMRGLVKRDLPIRTFEMMRINSMEFFHHHKQPILAALQDEHDETLVQIAEIEDCYSPCDGPVFDNTSEIGPLRLLEITEEILELPDDQELPVRRIRGIVCQNPMALKQLLKRLDRLKKIDHRVLGPQLDLFSYDQKEDSCVWHPRGLQLRDNLIALLKQIYENQGIEYTLTSSLSKNEAYAQLFKCKPRFLEELPLRFAEFSPIEEDFPKDPAGLFNNPFVWKDSSFVFCSTEQVENELIYSLQFILKIIRIFGVEYRWVFAGCRSDKKKSLPGWDSAKRQLMNALRACEIEYAIEGESDEGPRIDLHFIDSVGREWPGPSIGLDLLHPKSFDLHFQSIEGKIGSPVMIYRSLFGSLERLIALLIEKYEGDFPLWLTPEVVRVMPLGMKNILEAKGIKEECQKAEIRTGFDARPEKLAARIRAAEQEKVPFVAIIGDNEASAGVVAVRSCQGKGENQKMKIGELLERIKKETTFPQNT